MWGLGQLLPAPHKYMLRTVASMEQRLKSWEQSLAPHAVSR